MTTNDLKLILNPAKHIEYLHDEQDPSAGLRLLITDPSTGEAGVLAVEPDFVPLPDEAMLSYSYQVAHVPPMPHFEECDYNLRVAEKVEEQEGLFA